MAGSMNRVNTVVSSLKRFFSREDPRASGPLTPDGWFIFVIFLIIRKLSHSNPSTGTQQIRLPGSASTNSLAQSKFPSMRITDQVIEEVDEQMTITSQRPQESRPTAQSLFQGMPPTQPVDVPATVKRNSNDYMRTQSFAVNHHEPFAFPTSPDFTSSSAPASQYHVVTPTGDMYDINIDDFDQSQRGSRTSIGTVTTADPGGGLFYLF